MNRFRIKNLELGIKGFTLVELLISIALFGALATVVISVLFVSFRTSKKSDAIISIKQVGDAALLQMVGNIKFAKSLDDPLSCVPSVVQDSITVTSYDGGQTRYACPGVVTETVSSNSASLLDINSVKVEPDSCSFVCSQASTSNPPIITIKFTLSPASTTDFAENTASIPFQSTVLMRNYGR